MIKKVSALMTGVMLLASSPSEAQFNPLSMLSNMGNGGNPGQAVVGSLVIIAMSQILQQLNENERQSRASALQQAARSGSASWRTAGHAGKRATYRRVGQVAQVGGQKCQKVHETITLSDGKQAASEENVCFS